MAFLENQACGKISPKKVIIIVEKTKATTPVMTEPDSRVSKTLIPTFPQRMVDKRKLESCRNSSTFLAYLLPCLLSISSFSLLMLKRARFSPEKIADWLMHKKIPIQINTSKVNLLLQIKKAKGFDLTGLQLTAPPAGLEPATQ